MPLIRFGDLMPGCTKQLLIKLSSQIMPKPLKFLLFVFCGIIFSFLSFGQAKAADVSFSADTEVDLDNIPTNLFVKSSSECDTFTVTSNTVTAVISATSSMTFKTATYTALQVSPTSGTTTLSFTNNNFSTEYFTGWTTTGNVASAKANFSVKVPNASTYYLIKINGSTWDNRQSNANGFLNFGLTIGNTEKVFKITTAAGESVVGGTGGGTVITIEEEEETEPEQEVEDEAGVGEEEEEEKPIAEMSVGELKAEISRIQNLIIQLQSQLAELGSVTIYKGIPSNFNFGNKLNYGMTSNEVKYLQIVLKEEVGPPTYPEDVPATGWFGPITKTSVIEFQEKYQEDILAPWGLSSGTGLVGKTTIEKLNELLKQ
jgi:peptidoglycan hydrolase-like protein with peptidoglycan-binding domain